MSNHVMVDIETLGTAPGSAILSIGAVRFDPEAGVRRKEEIYYRVRLTDAMQYGTVDPKTLLWWMGQSPAARAEAFSSDDDPEAVYLKSALGALARFYEESGPSVPVWSNGASFDVVLLEHHYQKLFGKTPWKFWSVRDVRTIVHLAEPFCKRPALHAEDAHNAVKDARHQADYVMAMWKELRSRGE